MNAIPIAGSPPRVKATSTNSRPPLPELEALKIAGTRPFGCGDPEPFLAQAFALLTLLAEAHELANDAGGDIAHEFSLINPRITADALIGISSLIAVAQHAADVRQAKQEGLS